MELLKQLKTSIFSVSGTAKIERIIMPISGVSLRYMKDFETSSNTNVLFAKIFCYLIKLGLFKNFAQDFE